MSIVDGDGDGIGDGDGDAGPILCFEGELVSSNRTID